MEAFTASISVDKRLARFDIVGSIVHARMLGRQGIIPQQDANSIVAGLVEVWRDIRDGNARLSDDLEDIHMAVERMLFEKIGQAAGRLHTARSRNDQVALDMRLFAKEAIAGTLNGLHRLQEVLVDLAHEHRETVVPGYTHMQRAQPVLLAHHFLAYFEMLQRDEGRFRDCLDRVDVMPLGSGALAGAPYPLDRDWVAGELGFARVSANSLDGVSDRDFLLEYEAAASICMMHLSRFAEEVVLWSSAEFGFIELDDAFATGSSIMPQKKNPDVAELVRGKTGSVYGNLLALLTLMKGLPLSYNRDLQEDKPGFFATVDTLLQSLEVFAGMLQTMTVREDRTSAAAAEGYALATDLADYLVRQGLPFREAHHCVGELVKYATKEQKSFQEITLAEFQRFSPLYSEDVLRLTVKGSLEAKDVTGGTAPQQVAAQMENARQKVSTYQPPALKRLEPELFV